MESALSVSPNSAYLSGSLYVSGKLFTYPSPMPHFFRAKCLLRGGVGGRLNPDTNNDPTSLIVTKERRVLP